MSTARRPSSTGLRRFLDPEQQRAWIEGGALPPDAAERAQSMELRLKYAARYRKLMSRPQAPEIQALLGLYGRTCLPLPRRTERDWWSVSCLPSTGDKPLARVNAHWMEFFTLYADGEDIRARALVHLSDFTTDGSTVPDRLDEAFPEQCVATPEAIGWFFPRGRDIFGIKVRGAAAIRQFLGDDRVLRAIRTFNLTYMNRGRNPYQASHCYSLADCMLEA